MGSPYRMPTEPTLLGKARFAEFMRRSASTARTCTPNPGRIVLGDKVIDHERIVGVQDDPLEIAAVYEVAGEIIERVWFFPAE